MILMTSEEKKYLIDDVTDANKLFNFMTKQKEMDEQLKKINVVLEDILKKINPPPPSTQEPEKPNPGSTKVKTEQEEEVNADPDELFRLWAPQEVLDAYDHLVNGGSLKAINNRYDVWLVMVVRDWWKNRRLPREVLSY